MSRSEVVCRNTKGRLMRKVLMQTTFLMILGILSGLFLPQHASAQTYDDYTDPNSSSARRYGDLSKYGDNPFENPDEEGAPADTTAKQPKIRKPLESYFFDDSTRTRLNFAWHVDTYRNRIKMKEIDTVMNNAQTPYPFHGSGVGDAYQGNLGGASVPYSFFDRPQYQDFSFGQAFHSYYFHPETAYFFNVKVPFTRFNYYWAGQKSRAEENFAITHAQNISPSTGFNVDYKSRGTRGVYNWQGARDKNLSIAFSHTGKKYSIHAGYIYNAVLNKENGGITDDRLVMDTVIEMPSSIPTWLNDARNTIKNNTYYVVQSYGIPLRKLTDEDFSIADRSSIFVGHASEYHRWYKKYTDTHYQSSQYGDYYEDWYINPVETGDSIFESKFSNKVFVQIQPWDRDGVIGTIDGGVGVDMHHFYQFVPQNWISGDMDGENKTSYYVYGSVDGKILRYFDWGGDVMFHPAGYRSGDMKIGAHASMSAFIKGRPITLSGKFHHDRRSADYWSERLFSNHYVWSNSFDKENETRFEVELDIPSIDFEAKVMQSVVKNKVYYDAGSRPAQDGGSVSVTGVYASKGFRLGGFHFNHRVLLQWSTSQEVVPVPLAAVYLSYYYEFNVVKNVLRCQLGIDGRYNTDYYAQGWNPAIAQFYNQREKEVGGYPMLDVFLNAKWKRMRILLKLQHANDDLFGTRRYFTVPHYPQNRRVLQLGFSWNFYD